MPSKESLFSYATSVLGFDDCKFTSPFLGEELDEYRQLVANKAFGDMGYLERHLPFKEDPNLLLEGVQTAVVVIKNYKNTSKTQLDFPLKISRYATCKDYHEVMGQQLQLLADFITKKTPTARCYIGVDSRPLAERSLALKAGIGFRGKNTMVIKPKLGSYFFIGVVLTTLALAPDSPFRGTCGTCTRCIDACPTQAITKTGQLIPTQCISYKTIEQKTPITPDEAERFKGWAFGCDICQEVCPFNHPKTPLTDWNDFKPESGLGFDVFRDSEVKIPRWSAAYRSRHRLKDNVAIFKTNTSFVG
ncbi:MAG: tRNA epoxyqueuosine(34) reductase QueG [Candidatus Margulisiibacteriota bacterium]